MTEEQTNTEMSDEEALIKLASAMKDNTPSQEEKNNVHTFLVNVVREPDIDKIVKLGNLRDDKDLNELGVPVWTVRGALEMGRISEMIMGNNFFRDFFNASAKETVTTSLSREGFLIKQATTQTKQVADVTRRRRINKGMFKTKEEVSGGDVTGAAGGSNV